MALLYSSNFDAFTTGSLPPNWVDLDSVGWQVVAFRPVSGAKAFGMGVLTDNHIALWTGVAAMRDFDVTYDWEVLHSTGSGFVEENISVILRSKADGSTYYMMNPQWVAGTASQSQIYLYFWDGTGFRLVSSANFGNFTAGQIVRVRAQAQNNAFRFKAWVVGSSEPGWALDTTDTDPSAYLGNGYAGVRSGSGTSGSNSDPVVSIDNFTISDFSTPARTAIALTDPNLFKSPLCWRNTGSSLVATTSGSYLKFGFTGTSLEIDFGPAVAGNTVKYTVDGAPFVSYTVPSTAGVVSVAGLAAGTHQIEFYVTMATQGADKWVTPVSVVEVTGISVDNGSASAAPVLRALRAVFKGDSITEAVAGTGSNDATLGWVPVVARAIGAEYGQRGYGGIGWVMNNGSPSAVADVVPYFTPGDDANSHWNKFDASHSLLVSGAYPVSIDDLFISFGTNDALAGASDASIQASVAGALAAERGAGPGMRIWVVIPFGGFKASAITAGFNQYQAATPDAKCYLINLGADANLTGTISWETSDGYHPNAFTYAIKGAAVVEARRKKLNGGGINGSGILGLI